MLLEIPYASPVRRSLPRRFPLKMVLALVAGLTISACGGSSENVAGDWQSAPVIPELTGELEERFLGDVAIADAKGSNPSVFAKVGDSNTEMAANLYGFGCRPVEYGEYPELQAVVEKYNSVKLALTGRPDCQPVTSFSRFSTAARSGSYSTFPTARIADQAEGYLPPDPACVEEETALDCEIRLLKPRYTIILIGTNDVTLDNHFTMVEPGTRTIERFTPLVAKIRGAGSVPVLSNLPPSWVPRTDEFDEYGGVKQTNEKLAELAESEQIPLINLWRAMEEEQMIDRGLSGDGIHLSVYGGEKSPDVLANSVNLSEGALRYGANRRNLIWIQALAELDRVAAKAQD